VDTTSDDVEQSPVGSGCPIAGYAGTKEHATRRDRAPQHICQMPDMGGYEATMQIQRREGSRRHTPIIAVTAGAMAGERSREVPRRWDGRLT
jgi:hypothetical protein